MVHWKEDRRLALEVVALHPIRVRRLSVQISWNYSNFFAFK